MKFCALLKWKFQWETRKQEHFKSMLLEWLKSFFYWNSIVCCWIVICSAADRQVCVSMACQATSIVLCALRICCCRCQRLMYALPQMLQQCGLIPKCRCLWDLRALPVVKYLLQTSHLWGETPVCVISCAMSLDFSGNPCTITRK